MEKRNLLFYNIQPTDFINLGLISIMDSILINLQNQPALDISTLTNVIEQINNLTRIPQRQSSPIQFARTTVSLGKNQYL